MIIILSCTTNPGSISSSDTMKLYNLVVQLCNSVNCITLFKRKTSTDKFRSIMSE